MRLWLASASVLLFACNGQLRFEQGPDGGSSGVPQQCREDDDCRNTTFHCDVVSHLCVVCQQDNDCQGTGAPRCDVALHRCVECGTNLDCGSGEMCEPSTRRCVVACMAGAAEHVCPATAPTCNETAGFCIQCQSDADCRNNTDDGTHCELANGRCVFCSDDKQCPAATPRCDRTRGRCGQCIDSSDCPLGKVCDLGRQACQ